MKLPAFISLWTAFLAAMLLTLSGAAAPLRAQAPANDDCANAQVLTGSNVTVTGNNTNATVETGEGTQDGYNTMWYAWTPTTDGDATVAVTNPDGSFQHIVTIYLGSGIQSINLINSAQGGSGLNPTGAPATVTFPAKSGLTYRICFGSRSNGSGSDFNGAFSFNLTQATQADPWSFGPAMPTTNVPSNDACANAVAMTGSSLNVVGYNASATVEAGEGSSNPNGYNTVWYAWTAQQDGDVTLTVTNANYAYAFQHQVTVYLGGGIQTLNLINSAVGGSGEQFDNALATVTFPAKTGLTYRICFGSLGNGSGNQFSGPFSFTLNQATQAMPWSYGPSMPTTNTPSNDNCANAVAMTGTSLNIVGYNPSATVEVGEGSSIPNGYNTVWYAWTAQQDGDVTLTVTNANYTYAFQHQVTVYLGGGIQMLNLINSAVGGSGEQFDNALATVTFPAKTGLTYRICFGSLGNGSGNQFSGPFSFTLTQADQVTPWSYGPSMPTTSTPSNDNCANAVAMTGTSLNIVGYNPSATVEVGEGSSIPNGYNTVWYVWTAPQDGNVTLTVTNANYAYAFQHQLTVYLGGEIQTLNLVNSAVGGSGEQFDNALATLTFPAKSGLTYEICFGSLGNGSGNQFSGPFSFTLVQSTQLAPWDFGPTMPTSDVPNNDDVANATPMTGFPIQVVGYNADATVQANEPTQDGSKTLWYSWTAPSTQDVLIAVTDANGTYDFPHVLTVFTNNGTGTLDAQGRATGGNGSGPTGALAALKLPVKSGTVYYISFGSADNGNGNTFAGPFSFAIAPVGGAPLFTREAGVYRGIIGADAGFLSMTVSKTGSFTGKLTLNGKNYSLRGQFNSNGAYAKSFGNPTVTIDLQIGKSGATYSVTGSVNGEAIQSDKAAYSAGVTLAEKGTYTILLSPPGTSSSAVPLGVGYGKLTVSKTGNVMLAGRLADNTTFSFGGPVLGSTAGPNQFPVFDAALYRSKGLLAGVITFEAETGSDCDATMQWMKPAQKTGSYYRAGFATSETLIGSAYTRPTAGGMALDVGTAMNNVTVALTNGGLGGTFPNIQETATYSMANKVTIAGTNSDKLKVSVNAASGVLSGSFVDPESGRTTTFSGMLYQKSPQAAGFFLGPVVSGVGLGGAVNLAP